MTKEPKILENWQIAQVYLDVDMKIPAAVIRGFINGRFIHSQPLLWFDLEKKIAMSENETFNIGEPNASWASTVQSEGHSLDVFEIKDTNH